MAWFMQESREHKQAIEDLNRMELRYKKTLETVEVRIVSSLSDEMLKHRD